MAFINRCLEFLAPRGKLAIVLPDGILANISMQHIRDWILRWTKLKAVISLPQATFAPYGAGVKTSVVVLEKRETLLLTNQQLELGQKVIEADENYKVYMARIDNIGYDAAGRIFVSEDEAHEPPEVKGTIKDFDKCLGWLSYGE